MIMRLDEIGLSVALPVWTIYNTVARLDRSRELHVA